MKGSDLLKILKLFFAQNIRMFTLVKSKKSIDAVKCKSIIPNANRLSQMVLSYAFLGI